VQNPFAVSWGANSIAKNQKVLRRMYCWSFQVNIATLVVWPVSQFELCPAFLPANACPVSSTARRNLCRQQATVPAFGNAAAGYVGVPKIVAMECI
jgi:hypothetical protein